jgi:hypothetical protein
MGSEASHFFHRSNADGEAGKDIPAADDNDAVRAGRLAVDRPLISFDPSRANRNPAPRGRVIQHSSHAAWPQ